MYRYFVQVLCHLKHVLVEQLSSNERQAFKNRISSALEALVCVSVTLGSRERDDVDGDDGGSARLLCIAKLALDAGTMWP